MKKPLLGSKAVLISSDKNSRKTPPPSMPASSKPKDETNCTRNFKRKSDSEIKDTKEETKINKNAIQSSIPTTTYHFLVSVCHRHLHTNEFV